MLYLLGMLIVTVVAGALLLRFTVVVMGNRAGKFISETHGALEYIHATGAVPPQWIEPFQKKLQQLQQTDPKYQSTVERNVRSARKTCLRKLAKLRKYVYNSSLVQDEETRQILLEKLAKTHERWTDQNWNNVIGS